jgi:branched-chain amino acid transport system permease protein
MLFLLAAGLTLVFGIMNLINLAHGSLYMMGAYATAAAVGLDRLVPAGACSASSRRGCWASRSSVVAAAPLYARDHLDQVLATFG